MKKEYFIKYRKAVEVNGNMEYKELTNIITAKSGIAAWCKTTEDETEFNGLNLLDIKRI